jgi:uncharacterized membrane protein YqjE
MDNDSRSFGRLLADAVDQFAKLFRSEIAVARAELAEKVAQAASGAAFLVVAGLLLIPVVVLILLALASWLTELGLRPSLAQLCAGAAGLVVVGVLALTGKSRVTPRNLALTHTLDELARDADAVKRAL